MLSLKNKYNYITVKSPYRKQLWINRSLKPVYHNTRFVYRPYYYPSFMYPNYYWQSTTSNTHLYKYMPEFRHQNDIIEHFNLSYKQQTFIIILLYVFIIYGFFFISIYSKY